LENLINPVIVQIVESTRIKTNTRIIAWKSLIVKKYDRTIA
jgi:hypothetical protein